MLQQNMLMLGQEVMFMIGGYLLQFYPSLWHLVFCHLKPFLSWEVCAKLRVEDAKEHICL